MRSHDKGHARENFFPFQLDMLCVIDFLSSGNLVLIFMIIESKYL